MLSVNNVTKKYGKVIANENISLQIPGKCYGRWTSQQVNRGKTYYGLYS